MSNQPRISVHNEGQDLARDWASGRLKSAQKRLFQSVILKAIQDATAPEPLSNENLLAKKQAISWLENGGEDFILVCSLADVNGQALRQNWISGKVQSNIQSVGGSFYHRPSMDGGPYGKARKQEMAAA